uniref:Uncharacterized protein n=1 Tax=Anopheles melas TaxID=34690 RepID=A0A182UE77_9DIPT
MYGDADAQSNAGDQYDRRYGRQLDAEQDHHAEQLDLHHQHVQHDQQRGPAGQEQQRDEHKHRQQGAADRFQQPRPTVSEHIVPGPRGQVVVERFRIDHTLRVDQPHLRHQTLVDRVVHVPRLDQQLVRQDRIIARVRVPPFLRDPSLAIIPIKRTLQIHQPIAEQAQPKVRQPPVIVLNNVRNAHERFVVLVQQLLIVRILKIALRDGKHAVEAEQFTLHAQEPVLVRVLRHEVCELESVRELHGGE